MGSVAFKCQTEVLYGEIVSLAMASILPNKHHEQAEDDPLLFLLPTLWYPLFDIAHFICAALNLRTEHGPLHARQHPLASCTAMIISSFAGSFLTSLALGQPAVSPLQREDKVLLAVLVWLAVFFSPNDIVHSLVKNKVVHLFVCGMKEMYRVRKIVRGISLAQSHYPSSILIPVLVGVLKGNGSGFIRPLTLLVCGVWRPDQSELLAPSLTTRWCAAAAIAWISGKTLHTELLYNTLLVITVTIKLVQVVRIRNTLLDSINTAVTGTIAHKTNVEEIKESKGELLDDNENGNEVLLTNNTEERQKKNL